MTNIYDDYRPDEFTSRAEVVHEVELLAQAIVEADGADTIEEAKALAWTEVDGGVLTTIYRALPPDLPASSKPVAKSDRQPTLRDAIYEATRKRATIAQLRPGNFSKSMEELIVAEWETPEGSAVYDIYVSPYGRLPASKALATIQKSGGYFTEAMRIVQDWLET